MKDYAVVILDLPPLDGNEPVEEELKESKLCGFFFQVVWHFGGQSIWGCPTEKGIFIYVYL